MDVVVAAVATRQFGIITWSQLLRIGVSEGGVTHRVQTGRLHRVHEGVYAVGHSHLSRDGRLMAAVLAFPEGAVLSHRTAAERWALLPPTAIRPHVSSDARTLHGRPGIVLHRCRSLAPELRTEIDGIPVTTLERTLLDLVGTPQLKRAWHAAQRQRLLDVDRVIHLCDNSPGRRTKPLRALIAEAIDAPDTNEEMERRFADLIAETKDIPTPSFNAAVGAYVVDAVWVDQRVIVELDSRAYHDDYETFEADRQRDAELQLLGYRVYRVTWRELTARPEVVLNRLRRLLRTAPSPTPAARADGA